MFLVTLFVLVKKELSLMLNVNNAKLEKIAITKKNIAYKYLNDCVIFSLKISGK